MKAFISSTYQDLIDYRQKASEALERLGHLLPFRGIDNPARAFLDDGHITARTNR